MTNHQSMHAADCRGWGPKHYEYEVWQDGMVKAGGREDDYDSAKSEANHYARMYANDGPVEVRIYEQRLLSTEQIQPKRRRYDPYGSLSEYGIFPECDAQPLEAAQQPPSAPEPEVHSYDPTDQRQSVTIRWPDGKCLGYVLDRTRYTDNLPPERAQQQEGERDWLGEAMDALAEWRFDALLGGEDGPQAEIDKLRREVEEWRSFAEAQVELRDEAEDHAEDLAKSLAELITWIPSADTYRRLGFDPEAPMRALKRAKLSLGGVSSA